MISWIELGALNFYVQGCDMSSSVDVREADINDLGYPINCGV